MKSLQQNLKVFLSFAASQHLRSASNYSFPFPLNFQTFCALLDTPKLDAALKLYYQTKYKFSIVVRALNAIFLGLQGPSNSNTQKNNIKRKVLPRVKIFTFFHYRFRWTLAAYIFSLHQPSVVLHPLSELPSALSNFLRKKKASRFLFLPPSLALPLASSVVYFSSFFMYESSSEFPCTHIYLILKI